MLDNVPTDDEKNEGDINMVLQRFWEFNIYKHDETFGTPSTYNDERGFRKFSLSQGVLTSREMGWTNQPPSGRNF